MRQRYTYCQQPGQSTGGGRPAGICLHAALLHTHTVRDDNGSMLPSSVRSVCLPCWCSMCRCISHPVSEILTRAAVGGGTCSPRFRLGGGIECKTPPALIRTCVPHHTLHNVPSRLRAPPAVAPAVRALVALFCQLHQTEPTIISVVVFASPSFYHRLLHFELSPKSTSSWTGRFAVVMLYLVAASERGVRLNLDSFVPPEVDVTTPHF